MSRDTVSRQSVGQPDKLEISSAKTLSRYVSGYIFSITLTFAAYLIVVSYRQVGNQPYLYGWVLAGVLVLAVLQLFVQLYFFLHLGEESRPRWRLMSLCFAIMVVSLVVIGSIWIMSNLNYNMMESPQANEKYIKSQGDL